MRGLSENLQCKNPPFFINWLDPLDLSKRKKLSDLCYICPRGTREGMPLCFFEKSVFVKHTNDEGDRDNKVEGVRDDEDVDLPRRLGVEE